MKVTHILLKFKRSQITIRFIYYEKRTSLHGVLNIVVDDSSSKSNFTLWAHSEDASNTEENIELVKRVNVYDWKLIFLIKSNERIPTLK